MAMASSLKYNIAQNQEKEARCGTHAVRSGNMTIRTTKIVPHSKTYVKWEDENKNQLKLILCSLVLAMVLKAKLNGHEMGGVVCEPSRH